MKGFLTTILLIKLAITLSACGSSSDNGSTPPLATPSNVALATNGSTVSSNITSGNEMFLTDGDTTTTNFWVANLLNDFITVEFDQEYSISQIFLYTNMISNGDTQLQISTDGTNFTNIVYFSDCDQSLVFSSTNGRIECEFITARPATHIRVVIISPVSISGTELYELEVTGI